MRSPVRSGETWGSQWSLLLTGCLFVLLSVTGCGSDEATAPGASDAGAMSDAQLVEAIQTAGNKVDVRLDQIPSAGHNVLDRDYYDHVAIGAKMAPELGYEVNVRGTGRETRDSEVYFDTRGRKLNRGDRDSKCFELIHPVSYVMPDGTVLTVATDDKDGYAELRDWFKAHPDAEVRPALEFPVEVTIGDRGPITIHDADEMGQLRERCRIRDEDGGDGDDGPGGEHRECFRLIYPVDFEMPDGSFIAVTSGDEAGYADLKAWYAEHPDSRERPSLQYPVDIVFDGRDHVTTIHNDDEMRRAKAACRDHDDDNGPDDDGPGGGNGRCFRLVYPVDFVMPDGSVIAVTSDDEAGYADLKAWYADHPDSRERPNLQYPVDIAFRGHDRLITIHSEEEMRRARLACGDRNPDGGHDDDGNDDDDRQDPDGRDPDDRDPDGGRG